MNISELSELATGYWKSAALSAAVDLGIFDVLSAGAHEASQVSEQLNTSLSHTSALLDALAGMGVLCKSDSSYSVHEDVREALDPRSPNSLVPALRFNNDLYPLWGHLSTCIRKGAPIIPPDAHLGEDPDRTLRFVNGMHSRARVFTPALLPSIKLDGRRSLLDVASGPGTFSAALAERYEDLRVMQFDLPPVIEVARQLQTTHPAARRIAFRPGDYHRDPLPGGFDAVLYCGALHQESSSSAGALLEKIYYSLEPRGVFYLVDLMLDPDRTAPVFSALFSINMMLTRPSGHVFTGREIERLIGEAGFTDVSLSRLEQAPYWIARATRPA